MYGVVQVSPQPEKQHFWSPGQSLSSVHRLGQAASRRARFRGQRPDLAGEDRGLRVQLRASLPLQQ